jgi:hypothetical protein
MKGSFHVKSIQNVLILPDLLDVNEIKWGTTQIVYLYK